MAKGTTPRGTGPSRIRFIMVEADLNEGDLAQVTQVLQNAFRTPHVLPARPQAARLPSALPRAETEDLTDETDLEVGEAEEVIEELAPVRVRQPRKPRTAKVPDVLNDIDVKSDPTLKDFVAEYDVQTGLNKYLVIALWFRDARGINSVTVDHVYTCFRLLGWSTASTDFAKPLRNLRDAKSMTGDAKGYSLTLVGAGKIEATKRTA